MITIGINKTKDAKRNSRGSQKFLEVSEGAGSPNLLL